MSTDGTLAQQAYSRLREQLTAGALPPGMKLVNRTLASELGLSMTPVREAINRLASDGVVEYKHGAGAFVRELSQRDLQQIYDLRVLLEPYSAAQAAELAGPLQQQELRDFASAGGELARRFPGTESGGFDAWAEQWRQHEADFHLAIIRASNNSVLEGIMSSLRLLQRMFLAHRTLRGSLLTPATITQSAAEHEELVLAIIARNASLAERIMREHILRGQRHVLAVLRESSKT